MLKQSGGTSQAKMADDYTEWLPLAREEALSKHLSMNFIKQERHRDWFMNLAWAMKERGDKDQGRWLAKAFLFLRDFLPQGLVGHLAHIPGNDVVEHLLSSNKETATSRHKVTRDAHEALENLEEWMQKGKDWKAALENSKAGKSGGQRNAVLAPGLCSPAYLTAVLIIAHPDNKFRSWVGRLEIPWMLNPHETLDVRAGYWKGLDAQNLLTCFRPAGPAPLRTSLLADYDLLLGPRFSEARRDMRPYLPGWAGHLTLEEEPFIDTDLEGYNDQGRALGLHRLFHPSGTEAPDTLKAWLASQLGSKEAAGVILNTWCTYWADRIQGSKTHQERLILRSLFLQSLRILRGLVTARFTHKIEATTEVATTAYMLLDMEDTGLETRTPNPPATTQKMMNAPTFCQYTNKVAELSILAGTRGKEVDEIAAHQGAFFWELMKHGSFAKHSNHVIEFDTLRIGALIHAAKARAGEGADDHQLDSHSGRGNLMLTRWQDLQVILPGADLPTILTKQQLQALRQESIDGIRHDASSWSQPASPQELGDENGESNEDSLLRTLFGAPDLTPSDSTAASPQTTSTQASHATHATETSRDGRSASAARATSEAEAASATKPAEAAARSTPRPTPTPTPTPIPQAPAGSTRSRSGRSPAYQRLSSSGSTGARQDTAQPMHPMHPMLRLFKDNAQAGVKRHADGTPKASRLWEMTRQDLRDELSTQVHDEVKKQLDPLWDEITAMKNSLKALQEDPRLDLEAALVSTRTQTSADLRNIVDKQVANSIKGVLEGIDEVKGSLAKAREPGEEGFLSENCPTPEGWTHESCKQDSAL